MREVKRMRRRRRRIERWSDGGGCRTENIQS
jgi:hypothetical protein